MTEPINTPAPAPVPAAATPGPDHRAVAPVDPNKAFWRTALQVGPAAALGLLVILPQVLQDLLDNFGRQLPPGMYSFLVAATAALTLVASITARVMANARVIEWTRKYAPFFAPTQK